MIEPLTAKLAPQLTFCAKKDLALLLAEAGVDEHDYLYRAAWGPVRVGGRNVSTDELWRRAFDTERWLRSWAWLGT